MSEDPATTGCSPDARRSPPTQACRWLHQLLVMQVIITLRAGAGVRLVCEFL